MDYYSSQITKLIEQLSKLPGVGAKSAQGDHSAVLDELRGLAGGNKLRHNRSSLSMDRFPLMQTQGPLFPGKPLIFSH